MKSAIIGLGVIGNVHLKVLEKLDTEVVALCDIDKTKFADIKCKNFYTDYIKMLDSEQIDVLHICTPHYLHTEMIIEALKRNINVLCEKPLCIKTEDIAKIIDAEKNSKAKLGVCHQNRYNPENLFIKDYLKDKNIVNAFGSVLWSRGEKYYSSAEWRGKWNTEGGGVLINQALHTLDLLIWLCGESFNFTSKIANNSLHNIIEVEDTANIITKSEPSYIFYATNCAKKDFPVCININTETENITVCDKRVCINGKVVDFAGNKNFYGKKCYGAGHEALFKDFYSSIKNNTKFSINGEEASKVVKMILEVYKQNGYKV